MMDISGKYKHESLIFIKLKRHTRRIKDLAMNLMLISSICFSIFVIHKKQKNMSLIADIFFQIANNFSNGLNIISNSTYQDSKIKILETEHISKITIQNIIASAKKQAEQHSESVIQIIKNEILAIPFAKHVVIKKREFRSIEIQIVERNIAAYSKDVFSKQIYIIDDTGELSRCENCKISSEEFPYIENFSSEDVDFFNSLAQSIRQNCPQMLTNIAKYTNISSRRWDVTLKNDVKIMLPNSFTDEDFQKICIVCDKQLEIFSGKNSTIQYIDARVQDRIYYKPK